MYGCAICVVFVVDVLSTAEILQHIKSLSPGEITASRLSPQSTVSAPCLLYAPFVREPYRLRVDKTATRFKLGRQGQLFSFTARCSTQFESRPIR